jgi:hypothetical protein
LASNLEDRPCSMHGQLPAVLKKCGSVHGDEAVGSQTQCYCWRPPSVAVADGRWGSGAQLHHLFTSLVLQLVGLPGLTLYIYTR